MTSQNDQPKEPAMDTPETSMDTPMDTPETMTEDEILAALGEMGEDVAAMAQENVSEVEGFASPLEALAAENHKLDEEVADLKDQLLRTAAEMENLRRRTQKDVMDARNYSVSGFARDIIGVVDNLRRAIDHVDAADREQPGIKSLIEGVEMTEKEFLKTLEKNNVRQISPMNEKFDPNFHQAMFEIPNTEVPNNTILDVVQTGFMIADRVLRPAMVGISKGGPKTAPAPDAGNGTEADS